MRTALFWTITRRVVVIPTDVSGQFIGTIFKGQKLLTLEDGPIGSPVTWVRNYHCTLRSNPEERSSKQYIGFPASYNATSDKTYSMISKVFVRI
jgi:hypothetical protein